MMWRIKYNSEKENLSLNFSKAYASTLNETEMLVNLGIKYNIVQTKRAYDNMGHIMHQLCADEGHAIAELLNSVKRKYSL